MVPSTLGITNFSCILPFTELVFARTLENSSNFNHFLYHFLYYTWMIVTIPDNIVHIIHEWLSLSLKTLFILYVDDGNLAWYHFLICTWVIATFPDIAFYIIHGWLSLYVKITHITNMLWLIWFKLKVYEKRKPVHCQNYLIEIGSVKSKMRSHVKFDIQAKRFL